MTATTGTAGTTREITLTRVYDAPRDVVWALWTEADHISQWWGPDDFTASCVTFDPRNGGSLHIEMAGQGISQTVDGTYREVDAPSRLVVDSIVPGEDGTTLIASSHTVTFDEIGDRTRVTVNARAIVFGERMLAALAGMKAGWNQSLQKSEDALHDSLDRQIVLTRLYPAPPEVLFPLWIEQRHLERWYGPDGFTITVEEFDLRPGGKWRFTMHGPDGTDYPNLITFLEIVPKERLVVLKGTPEDAEPPFTQIVTLDEMAGQTALSMRLVFDSAAELDRVVATYNAVEGGTQTLSRLAALLDGLGPTA